MDSAETNKPSKSTAGMPKERIQGAINRGQGISANGVALETLMMEAMGPGSVALVL